MIPEVLRVLTGEELRLARLLAWEEVKAAPEGSAQKEVWSDVLLCLVLEALRRDGKPVEDTLEPAENILVRDAADLSDADFRALRRAFEEYGSGKGPGSLVAEMPTKTVWLRYPRLERFWLQVKALIERGGDL